MAGKTQVSKGFLWLIGIAVVVIAVGMLALVFTGTMQTQYDPTNIVGEGDESITCPERTASLSFPVKDSYTKSTSVSATPYGRIGDGGITNLSGETFGIGTIVSDVFYSADNYIDAKLSDSNEDVTENQFQVKCTMTQAPTANLKPTDTPDTFYIADRSGTQLTNSATGGANNASATSGTLELELVIGASKEITTGDLVAVVEYDNTTQANDIGLGNLESYTPISGSLDDIYEDESSSASVTRAFEIPEVEDGATEDYALKVYPETDQTLESSAVRLTIMSKQAFEDTNGEVVEGVANSDGTSKYEDTTSYKVYVGASA